MVNPPRGIVAQVNIYEAKARLSELIDHARRGETVIIAKAGRPMAKLVPSGESVKRKINFGLMKGKFDIPADFDDALSDAELAVWEGREPKAYALSLLLVTRIPLQVLQGSPRLQLHKDPFDRMLVAQAISEPRRC